MLFHTSRLRIAKCPWSFGFAALGFIVMLLLGRMFTVMELRSLERDYRQNQGRFSDLEEDLDTSRRKYLVALKSEGVGSIR